MTALLRIVADLRVAPNEEFRASLKRDLMAQAMKERKNMTSTVTWIREGFRTLTPYLHVSSAAGLIDFLKQTFGAEEKFHMPRPDGTIMHSEFSIGDSRLELAEVPDDLVGPRATALRVFVPDVDAVYSRALEAGATSLYKPVVSENYGDREAGLKDPAGNYWFLSRHLSGEYKDVGVPDVTPWVFPRGASSFIEFLEKAFGAGSGATSPGPQWFRASRECEVRRLRAEHGRSSRPVAADAWGNSLLFARRRRDVPASDGGWRDVDQRAREHALRRPVRRCDRSARELLVSGDAHRRYALEPHTPNRKARAGIPVIRVNA